jgi:catechol 2,3-dioxygenase-like lactoylglutathione lyase family enzyme
VEVLIRHLALTASDPARSAEFYLSVIGLEGEAREQPWGIRLDLRDGFMLALIQGEPLPPGHAGTVHFGCALATPALARATRERLRAAGVVELEWDDEDRYTGVKVADPDGYVVELSYDAE